MALLEEPPLQAFLVMLLVMLLERLWPLQRAYHPLTLFRLLAWRMGEKVNPSDGRSAAQQRISGILALPVLLLPLLVLLGFVINLAEFPLFFDGLLLYLSLYFEPARRSLKWLSRDLSLGKKSLARERLAQHCLRQTSNLSELGLIKAGGEMLLLRFAYQYLATLCWFLLGGGLAALAYRLLLECQQAWNLKQPRYRIFGQAAATLSMALAAIPARIMALLILLVENLSRAGKAFMRDFGNHNKTLLLSVSGSALGIELGGPAMYDSGKWRFAKHPGRRPQGADLARIDFLLLKIKIAFASITLLGCALIVSLPKL